eukprot:7387133-Prymnesium_polylepis.2
MQEADKEAPGPSLRTAVPRRVGAAQPSRRTGLPHERVDRYAALRDAADGAVEQYASSRRRCPHRVVGILAVEALQMAQVRNTGVGACAQVGVQLLPYSRRLHSVRQHHIILEDAHARVGHGDERPRVPHRQSVAVGALAVCRRRDEDGWEMGHTKPYALQDRSRACESAAAFADDEGRQ